MTGPQEIKDLLKGLKIERPGSKEGETYTGSHEAKKILSPEPEYAISETTGLTHKFENIWNEKTKSYDEVVTEISKQNISKIDTFKNHLKEQGYDIYKNFSLDSMSRIKFIEKKGKENIDIYGGTIAKRKSVFLAGPTGRGKTTLAIALLREYVTNKNMPTYQIIRWHNYFSKIQQNYLERDKHLEKIKSCDVLLIDELGADFKEQAKDSERELISEIISEKYSNNKLIIVTTNMNLDQFKKVYGNQVYSRLVNSIKCQKLTLDNEPEWRALTG